MIGIALALALLGQGELKPFAKVVKKDFTILRVEDYTFQNTNKEWNITKGDKGLAVLIEIDEAIYPDVMDIYTKIDNPGWWITSVLGFDDPACKKYSFPGPILLEEDVPNVPNNTELRSHWPFNVTDENGKVEVTTGKKYLRVLLHETGKKKNFNLGFKARAVWGVY
jgi:hypothetical protein